jgi:hypothetical protein
VILHDQQAKAFDVLRPWCRCWLAWQRLSPLSLRSRFLDPGVQAYAFTFG